jgi:hypothetical protein
MSAINFSAQGSRWRVLPITSDALTTLHVPPLPGTGLLFLNSDGDMRFLAFPPEAVPTAEHLQRTPIAELGSLVQSAQPLPR